MNNPHSRQSGIFYALAAALLFGASAPFAKILLAQMSPWALAGILYLGAGAGLLAVFLVRRLLGAGLGSESCLRGKDLVWLSASTVFGGILAPLMLMAGLEKTEGSVASLLLNLETVFTVALAWFVFKEPFQRGVVWGLLLILAGAVWLSWPDHLGGVRLLGAALVVAACLGWAIDNNVTRKISARDPVQIAMIKSLVAGIVNISLAGRFGSALPKTGVLVGAGMMGFVCYGVSLCCFIVSLRKLGTAKTSAVFAFAPFVGAALSPLLLGEPFLPRTIISGFLMILGTWLYLRQEQVLHSVRDKNHSLA